ncbi:MAG: T9SS type A sorting domain-containing protein [Bacteroidota bacterium]|nr:T9SS type A sorting domain-containing protein [Bacteroidota bacterium]MDP4233826.1 T9SS type A sorting domain-containing protein [Bacteroidota bacterium]MDP4242475.1 T9SS type A sorting domain-containing protein [Bacteroidota bacterium]MDP4289063.1 T9SS type A sorting domain-containing protein [Bacteroidota bacterium]
MRKTLIVIAALYSLFPVKAVAQWRAVLKSPHFWSLAVYFLDHQGKPDIGFVNWNRTTDGGYTWHENYLQKGYDYVFKDSLTGWAANLGVLGTTDAGLTWRGIYDNEVASALYFNPATDGLFMGTFGFPYDYWSWDEGKTWVEDFRNQFSTGFAFASDSLGLLASQNFGFWLRTTDGGRIWGNLNFSTECWQPLGLKGTKIFYGVADWAPTVIKTTDAGDTWQTIATFSPSQAPPDYLNAYSTGCIRGDSSKLIVQLLSGCYISTDQGLTWKSLCGPVTKGRLCDTRFYLEGNRLFVPTQDGPAYQSTLWYLNLDSLQDFPTGISFPDGSKREQMAAGNLVTVNYSSAENPSVGIGSAHFAFHFDASLELQSLKLPPSWKIVDSSTLNGVLDLTIEDTDSTQLPNPIVSLTFRTVLAASSAKVYLDSAHLYGKRLNCDCAALSLAGPDSVEIDFTGCGDPTLLRTMSGQSPFEIVSVVPNPAQSEIEVQVSAATSCEYSILDMLGREVGRGSSPEEHFTVSVASLPTGIYHLRASSGGLFGTRQFLISR